MAMQTDVKSTKPLASSGVFKTQTDADCAFRTRVKGIYIVCGASAGSVDIRDSETGPILLTLTVPSVADAGSIYMLVPDQGILAENGLYGTMTNAASTVLFYG